MVFRALGAVAALLWSGLALAGSASAESYPAHPVRLIVPFAAGGPTDVIARIVAQKLSEAWGQQVYTENVPGAGGNTGVAMAARAPRRRLHHSRGEHRLHRQSQHVRETPLRSGEGFRTDHPWSPPRPTSSRSIPTFRQSRCKRAGRSGEVQSGQIQLRAARRPARPRTSPANCSSRNTGSTSSPCRSTARRSRSTPPSGATRRSHSRRCRRP